MQPGQLGLGQPFMQTGPGSMGSMPSGSLGPMQLTQALQQCCLMWVAWIVSGTTVSSCLVLSAPTWDGIQREESLKNPCSVFGLLFVAGTAAAAGPVQPDADAAG